MCGCQYVSKWVIHNRSGRGCSFKTRKKIWCFPALEKWSKFWKLSRKCQRHLCDCVGYGSFPIPPWIACVLFRFYIIHRFFFFFFFPFCSELILLKTSRRSERSSIRSAQNEQNCVNSPAGSLPERGSSCRFYRKGNLDRRRSQRPACLRFISSPFFVHVVFTNIVSDVMRSHWHGCSEALFFFFILRFWVSFYGCFLWPFPPFSLRNFGPRSKTLNQLQAAAAGNPGPLCSASVTPHVDLTECLCLWKPVPRRLSLLLPLVSFLLIFSLFHLSPSDPLSDKLSYKCSTNLSGPHPSQAAVPC